MKKYIIILLPIVLISLISINSLSTDENKNNMMVASNFLEKYDNDYIKNDFNIDCDSKILYKKDENLSKNQYNIDLLGTENIFHIKINKIDNKSHNSLINQINLHTVKKGENLWSIAQKYNINIDTLIGANDISNMNKIKPGEKIKILPVKGILYKLGPGENLGSIANRFNISIKNILKSNNIKDADKVQQGRLLILPGAKPEFSYKDRLQQLFISPVHAPISSDYGMRWGRMHEGVDYSINTGTAIRAAGTGRVTYSGWVSGYGNTVIIEHQRGLKTLYAHNSKLLVNVGEKVYRGEIISESGNTGNTTGPHLHFEVRVNGRPANPINYLRDNN